MSKCQDWFLHLSLRLAAPKKSVLLVLICMTSMGGAAGPVETHREDMDTLVRHIQMEEWVGAAVPLAQGVCAQQNLLSHHAWPRTEKPSERQVERLQQVLEKCSRDLAMTEQGSGDRGLLTGGREDLIARLHRLNDLIKKWQSCIERSPKQGADCLQFTLERSIPAQDKKILKRLDNNNANYP